MKKAILPVLAVSFLALSLVACGPQAPQKVQLTPDDSYGDHGAAVAPDVGSPGSGEVGFRLLKSGGRIILVGHGCSNGSANCGPSDEASWVAAAWGFDEDGNPDAGFATGGAFLDGNAAGGNSDNMIFDAVTTSAGLVFAGDGLNASNNLDGVLWALDNNGALDATRFASGKANVGEAPEAGAHDFVEAMKVDGNYIWLAGAINGSIGYYRPAIWRVKQDGALDSSFGTHGVYLDPVGSNHSWFDDVAVTGGAVVAAGSVYDTNSRPVVTKVLPTGALDASFGSGGRAYLPLGGYAQGRALEIAVAEGKIVAAGYVWSSDEHIALWRLNADGSPDNSFGSGGALVFDDVSPASYGDKRIGLAVDDKSRYWLAGGLENAADDLVMALWRVLPDGKLDPDFCEGAPCTFASAAGSGADAWGADLLLDRDAVYVGGWSSNGSDRDAVVWKLAISPAN